MGTKDAGGHDFRYVNIARIIKQISVQKQKRQEDWTEIRSSCSDGVL